MYSVNRKTFTILLIILLAVALVVILFEPLPAAGFAHTEATVTSGSNLYLPIIFKSKELLSRGPMGGTFTAVLVDPDNNSVLYLGTYGAGVYKSTDQGSTWSQQNSGLGSTYIQSLAIDPQNSQTVWAGTYGKGIYKSINSGGSWVAANGTSLGNQIVYDLEIDPQNTNILFAATRIPDPLNSQLLGFVYKSADGGATWAQIFAGSQLSSQDYFYDIEINPLNTSEIYLAAHQHGFYKSTNGGSSFSAVNTGVSDLSARSVVLDPASPKLLYGGVWHGGGVFRSLDGGEKWSNFANGLPEDVEVYRLVIDLAGGSVKPVFACTFENGLYRSTDQGASWRSAGLDGQFLYDFALSNGASQRWYAATSYRGLYLSQDYGVSWAVSHNGVSSANITGLASISSQSGRIYAAVYGLGVMTTSDGGQTWTLNNTGLGDFSVTNLLALDDKLYALTSSAVYVSYGDGWTALPLPYSSTYNLQGYVSETLSRVSLQEELLQEKLEGQSSVLESTGINAGNVPLISLASLDGVLYGGTAGGGLWTYSFLTGSWSQVNFTNDTIPSLAADSLLGRLLVSACDGGGNCSVWVRENNGNWSVINEGLTGLRTNELIIRGDDYFAATSSGIFIRDNTGKSWQRVAAPGANVLSLTYSLKDSCLLAAGSVGYGYHSTNCGTVWQKTSTASSGWSFNSAIFDPDNASQVLFGSKEAGTFLWTIE